MGTEIERKYLLQGDEWKTPEVLATAKRITQTYLATNEGSQAQIVRNFRSGGHLVISRSRGEFSPSTISVALSESAIDVLGQEANDNGVLPLENNFEARIRIANGVATLTLKGGKGIKRTEFETAIELETADEIIRERGQFVGKPIEKTRYRAELPGGLIAEIDIFEGANEGLRVVEVELPDVDTKVPETSWIGRDITNGDLGNAKLALNPFSERGGNALSSL